VDLRTSAVPFWRRYEELDLKFPGRRFRVSGDESKEVLLTFPSLNGDMDVVMPVGEVRSGAAVAAGEVRSFDLNEHSHNPQMSRVTAGI
jgi:hypothetical protein